MHTSTIISIIHSVCWRYLQRTSSLEVSHSWRMEKTHTNFQFISNDLSYYYYYMASTKQCRIFTKNVNWKRHCANNNEFLAEKMWKENKLKHNCKHLKNNFFLYSIPVLMIYIPYRNGTKALSQTNTNSQHTYIHSNMQAAASFSFTTTLKLNVIKTRHSNYMKFIQIKYHWYKYGMLRAFASFDNILAIRSATWTDLHLNLKRFIEKKRCFTLSQNNKSKNFENALSSMNESSWKQIRIRNASLKILEVHLILDLTLQGIQFRGRVYTQPIIQRSIIFKNWIYNF